MKNWVESNISATKYNNLLKPPIKKCLPNMAQNKTILTKNAHHQKTMIYDISPSPLQL